MPHNAVLRAAVKLGALDDGCRFGVGTVVKPAGGLLVGRGGGAGGTIGVPALKSLCWRYLSSMCFHSAPPPSLAAAPWTHPYTSL